MTDRQAKLPIGRQARLWGIRRGSVYYWPKPVSEHDLDIMKRLHPLHLKQPFMGAGYDLHPPGQGIRVFNGGRRLGHSQSLGR